MLDINDVRVILRPQFGSSLAKSGGEPLWTHSFTLWSIAAKLMKFIPRFDDRERRLLEITVLIHDIGKLSAKNQAILTGASSGKVKHTQTNEQIKTYFIDNGLDDLLNLSVEDIDFIYHAHLHHNLPEEALKTAPPSLAVYADVVRYADWLASQESLDRRLLQHISSSLEPFCQLTAATISRPEGPSNYLLFDTAATIYKDKGWDLLVVVSNAIVLIAPKETPYPKKAEVVEKFQDRLVKESLKLQVPSVTNFAAVLLAGESAKNPRLYLDVHKDIFKDALSDFDRAPSFFFKMLIEMFDISGKLTADVKQKYPILDILKGLCGTRGIPIARNKWIEMGGEITEPLKEMLKEMFGKITIGKIVPLELNDDEEHDKILNTPPEQLYGILYRLAEKLFHSGIDTSFQNELQFLVSMEEETDFREIVLKRFERYKEYKTTQNPEKGVCESCGFTIAFPTQKSLNFPGGKRWGFSQISAHTDSARATCTLCAYDTMTFRKGIPESKNPENPVYVRVESKTTDIWQLYDEVSTLIQRLDAAFYNPYTLETLDKNIDYGFLPLPKDFKMPRIKEPKYVSQPLVSVRGYVIPIARVDSSASPKDLRARYLSLYALLKMMGFNTHIGFEEQNGLFGDKSIAKQGEKYENLYYRGLAVKWLAGIINKTTNANIFAESLLTKSPSVALAQIGGAASDKKAIKEEQLSYIVEAIIKGGFKIKNQKNGGEYSMKELLQDAAFFAEGIPSFIWSGSDHKSWFSNSSKHLITKPVSKAMNCILQGDDFETAFAKFLSLIKEDISGDKTKQGSVATVDIKDLEGFIGAAKEIFSRYYDLRQADVSAFIQAKNALLSSIYLLKRYPNIKEVVNG